jgi:hypothetical protein
LNDFPGQGTALVGVLDAFWEEKGYIKPEEFRQFSGDSVPLVALQRHIFEEGDELTAPLLWAHFGPDDLPNFRSHWAPKDKRGKVIQSGHLEAPCLKRGQLQNLGSIALDFREVEGPQSMTLEVEGYGQGSRNAWSIFVYPKSVPESTNGDILIAKRWTREVLRELQAGARVWLQANPMAVETDVALGYSSIFWNTAWTKGQPPHTMGILCQPEHPALSEFPTESHSDWQWWYILQHARTLELSMMDWTAPSIIQVVPDWFAPQHLSLAFEAKVGKGQLLMTSIDFSGHLDPVRRQLHHSLMSYWTSGKARPEQELNGVRIKRILNRW